MEGEFDYDETVDVLTKAGDKEAPPAMHRVSLSQAIQAIVEQWSPSQKGNVLISREGPDITSYEEVLAIYNREDFPGPSRGQPDRAPGYQRTRGTAENARRRPCFDIGGPGGRMVREM